MINIFKISLPYLFIVFSFCLIGTRLFFIQIWHHEQLSKKVDNIVCKERQETPCRGMILDKNGNILAMSMTTYTLFADLNIISNMDELVSRLNEINIKTSKAKLISAKNKSFVVIAKNIDDKTQNAIKSWKIRGLGFIKGYNRKYPEDTLACHLLGVVGNDGRGLEGVEYVSNTKLAGEESTKLLYRDGCGREIPDELSDIGNSQGSDVYLTIDRNLQFIAEQEIEEAWKRTKSKKGIIIIQDPNTGEILALACRPNYNPGDFSGSWKHLKNPAISDIYEPGSTFKIVTAAAALEEKVAKRSEVIWCENGKYQVYDHVIKDHEKRGLLTMDEVLEYSSNIGTAKIGERLGKNNLYKYVRQFGFYSKTGINLPGEARGLLNEPSKWSGLSLPVISFGQGIGVTAIQVINAYSSIANGGHLLKPSVIKKVKSPEGETIYVSTKQIIRECVSKEVADNIKEMLKGVVNNGTGKLAQVEGYSVGGKTGTAQKRDPKTNKYSSSAYVVSFCGFLPVSDPKLTIYVILDEPEGDYWASTQAAPVFQRVAARAVQYLRIEPDNKAILLANKTK